MGCVGGALTHPTRIYIWVTAKKKPSRRGFNPSRSILLESPRLQAEEQSRMAFMKNLIMQIATVAFATSGLVFGTIQTAEALTWSWSYSGDQIEASGTFITNNTPDELGFYLITDITGTRNGETITGLQTTGTSIPGNEPFEVENLISLNNQQLTGDGFGYSTSGGNFINVFFADFLDPPGYFEVFSAPPIIPGFENLGAEDSELPISFSPSPVPELTNNLSLFTLGIVGVVSTLKLKIKISKSTEKDCILEKA